MNGRPLLASDHCHQAMPGRTIRLTIRGARPVFYLPTEEARSRMAAQLVGLTFEEWERLMREREAVVQ